MISLLYFLTLTIFDIGLYYICVFVVRVNLHRGEMEKHWNGRGSFHHHHRSLQFYSYMFTLQVC